MEKVAQMTGLSPGQISRYGLVAGIALVMLGIGNTYITCLLGVAYPCFMSFLALESDGADDDKLLRRAAAAAEGGRPEETISQGVHCADCDWRGQVNRHRHACNLHGTRCAVGCVPTHGEAAPVRARVWVTPDGSRRR